MRKRLLFLAIVLSAESLSGQTGSGTTVDELSAAIARGAAAKEWEGLELKPSRMSTITSGVGFTVTFEGPLNRVANEAWARSKKYLPFTVDSVTPELLDSVWAVTASPRTTVSTFTNDRGAITPAATHIVLAAGEGLRTIVQPVRTELFDVEVPWTPPDSRKEKVVSITKGIRAWFPYNALPPGAFEVRIITDSKEFKLSASVADRKRMR